MVEKPDGIIGHVPIGERRGPRRLAPTALVVGDDPIAVAERGDLMRPHLMAHEEFVAEQHRWSVTAGVLVIDGLSVDVRERHVANTRGSSTLAPRGVDGASWS